MAKIDVMMTSGRAETYVRGRVMRSQAVEARQKQRSKERRRVCLLSVRGGRELEMWNQNQPCYGAGCTHTHITRDAALSMERDGIIRFLGKGRNVAAYTFGRKWVGAQSGYGGPRTMQLL
jgi:hypothetical protein